MFENFREWLSDNLRYIFLGLAVILVIVAGVMVVNIMKDTKTNDSETGSESIEQSETPASDVVVEGETKSAADPLALTTNQAIIDIATSYLNSQKDGDVEIYQSIVANVDSERIARLNLMKENAANYVEEYQNIICYTKNGLENNSYFVYIYYETKFANAENTLPGITSMYVRTNDSGKLYIEDLDVDAAVLARAEELKSGDEEVVALITKVQNDFTQKYESDADAKAAYDAFNTFIKNSYATEEVTDEVGGTGTTGTTQTNRVVTVKTEAYVRSDSRTDADVLGVIQEGATITRVQVLDNGWTEVKYGELRGYIYSEYLSE